MQYRTLGRTGLNASEIGFGGGRIRLDQDPQIIIEILHQAFDAGLNFLDTAPTYGGGTSENIIGKAITGKRNELIIMTKTKAYDLKGIIASVEESLTRLNTDVIDILQFHGGWFTSSETSQVLKQGGLEAYKKLQNQGKIRFIGFSADGPSTGVEQMIATNEFDMMQIHYNLMPATLESGNETNYISLNFPQGLLYCCLAEAYGYLKGPMDMLTLYENKYKQEIEKFAAMQIGRRRRDDYTDGTVRIPIESPPQ